MQTYALRCAWTLHRSCGGGLLTLQRLLSSLGTGLNDGIPSSPPPAFNATSAYLGERLQAACLDNIASISGRCASFSTAAQVGSPTPATGAFSVEVVVQGFEKRYVDMACNAIDDIIMLAFAPKSYSALPAGAPTPTDLPVNLAFGTSRRDVRLPWKRTRFTLLRSPHVDKQGMEQFERREYKSVLTAATNNRTELQRLLEALKIYQFTGVQIRLDVTSAQQLQLPPDLNAVLAAARGAGDEAAGADAGVRQPAQGRVLGSASAAIPAPRSPEAHFEAELRDVLGLLRPMVWSGLKQRRSKLPDNAKGQQRQGGSAAVDTPSAAPPSGGLARDTDGLVLEGEEEAAYGELLRLRLQQLLGQLHQNSKAAVAAEKQRQATTTPSASAGGDPSPSDATAPAVRASSYGLEPAVAAELLAKIDAELLQARTAALQPQTFVAAAASTGADGAAAAGPALVAGTAGTAAPPELDAEKMTPAEYAHAVLKYVQYVDWLQQQSAAGVAARGHDRALQLSAPSLALRLLQLWWAATSVEFKQHLGLPPAAEEKRILEELLQQREKRAKEADREWETSAGARVGRDGARQGGRTPLFRPRAEGQ